MQPTDANTPGAVEVTTWHLEIGDEQGVRHAPPPKVDARVVTADRQTIEFARWLYHYVGDPWHWVDRREWTDQRWQETIDSPNYRHITCLVGGIPAGYCEYDLQGPSAEITYFGLGTDVHGNGVGGWFLTEAIQHGFAFDGIERVWLHTCSLDGPHARANYEARGMRVFDTEIEWKVLG